MRNTSSACSISPRCTHALTEEAEPLGDERRARRRRASAPRACAGRWRGAPASAEELDDLAATPCGAPRPPPRRPWRGRWRCARPSRRGRAPRGRGRGSGSGRRRDRSVSSTPSWRTTSSARLSSSSRRACAASSRRAARGAGSGRRCRAGWPRSSVSRVGAGAGSVVLDEERADEAAAEVGEREPLRLEVVRRRRRAPTTKSTSVRSGLRRSTVSAVMRAPTMIEKAKKRSPTISQSAWKHPMPSPMRSNQPSVRTASRENSCASPTCSRERSTSHEGPSFVESPVPADRLDAAAFALVGSRPRRTALEHAHVAEGEVVLDGVAGVEAARARVISSVVCHERSRPLREAEVPGRACGCGCRPGRAARSGSPSTGRGRRRRPGGPSSAGRGAGACSRWRRGGRERRWSGPRLSPLRARACACPFAFLPRGSGNPPAPRIASQNAASAPRSVPATSRSTANRRPSEP